jgi:hypothetical protein
MKQFRFTVIAALIATFFSAAAFAEVCINRNQIRRFDAYSSRVVFIETGSGDYRVDVELCPELRWVNWIGFRTWPQNSWWICRGDDVVTLAGPNGPATDFCRIRRIEKVNGKWPSSPNSEINVNMSFR